MGFTQAVQPVFGEEGIRPALVVRSPSPTVASVPLTQKAAQTTTNPAVQRGVDVPVTMTKVREPALQRRSQRRHDAQHTVPIGPPCLAPNLSLELPHPFLPPPPQHSPAAVAQEVKALRPSLDDFGPGRMQ